MNAWTWLLQRISAVVLLVVLGCHIWFLHFANEGEILRYGDITIRLKTTTTFMALDILLLVFGLYHALYGLYSVFLDFGFGLKAKAIVLFLLVIAGIGFLGFGIYGFWSFMA